MVFHQKVLTYGRAWFAAIGVILILAGFGITTALQLSPYLQIASALPGVVLVAIAATMMLGNRSLSFEGQFLEVTSADETRRIDLSRSKVTHRGDPGGLYVMSLSHHFFRRFGGIGEALFWRRYARAEFHEHFEIVDPEGATTRIVPSHFDRSDDLSRLLLHHCEETGRQ